MDQSHQNTIRLGLDSLFPVQNIHASKFDTLLTLRLAFQFFGRKYMSLEFDLVKFGSNPVHSLTSLRMFIVNLL